MITWQEHIQRNKKYEKKMVDICSPLVEKLGVTHFSYARIRKDGGFSWISNYSKWDSLYFEQKLYMQNPLLADPDSIPEGIIVVDRSTETSPKYEPNQGIAVIQRRGSYVEGFGFAWTVASGISATSLATEPGLLNAFIDHFKMNSKSWRYTLLSHPIDIKSLKGKEFDSPTQSVDRLTKEQRQDFLRGLGIENTYPGLFSLSKREIDVLELYALHWSLPKIGEALDLSPRTVESYLKNVKNKLGVATNSELLPAAQLVRTANGR